MSMRTEGARTEYAVRRRSAGHAELEVDWVLGEPTDQAAAGTLDHFLIERYSLFVRRGGAIYRGRVLDQPYPLRDVTIEHLSETMLGAAGRPRPSHRRCITTCIGRAASRCGRRRGRRRAMS
jgi:uncharacterized protein YqjF (DUF2071 family)